MSESDFMDITLNGTLCNADGEIGSKEFETVMRKQVTTYLQTRLTDFSDFRTSEDIEFTHLGAVKTILSGVLILVEEQRTAREEMKDALNQLRQSSQEGPTPQKSSEHLLGENGVGISTTKGVCGTETAKALQTGMEALAAELVGVKTAIQEHASELRRAFSIQSAHLPSVSSLVNSISSSLEGQQSDRRRRPPRRDWASFILAGSGSGRTASSSTAASPAAPAGSPVRAIPAIKFPETKAAGPLAGQECQAWSAPDSSGTSTVVSVSTLRRDSGVRGGKKPAAVVPDAAQAADRRQKWGASAKVPAAAPFPLEIASPTLRAADKAHQLAGTPANADASAVPSIAVPRVPAQPSALTVPAASPLLNGGSRRHQVENEVVLVPSPAVCSSPAAFACNGDHSVPFQGHHGPGRGNPSSDAPGSGGRLGLGIAGPADGAAAARRQQPWVESELVVATSTGDLRPAALPEASAAALPTRSGASAASTVPPPDTSSQAKGAVIRLPTQGPSAFQPPVRRRAASDEPQRPVTSADGPPMHFLPPVLRPVAPLVLPPSP